MSMDPQRHAAPAHAQADDLSALAWVLEELRKSLEQAHKGLRRYLREAEASASADLEDVEPAVLRNARQQLHGAVGALQLVNEAEGAQLLRASEAAVQRFVQRPQRADAKGVETIERASFALLDYLGRRLAGKPAPAVGLFPQLRALLELNGAERIHPADLWPMDWRWRPIAPVGSVGHPVDATMLADVERRMLGLVKTNSVEAAAGLSRAFDSAAISARAGHHLAEATLWSIAAGFFEAWGHGLIEPDLFVKRTGSRAMAALRAKVKSAEVEASERLAQDLLFFCARALPVDPARSPYLQSVWAGYQLRHEAAGDYAEPRYGRHDPALIVQARKRIASAKEVWNGVAGAEPQRLANLTEAFSLVGDSMRRLYPSGEDLAGALANAAEQCTRSGRAPAPQLAMEVATSLLYLEAALDDGELDQPDQGDRARALAQRIGAVAQGHPAQPLDPWMEELYRRVSDRQTLGSVVQELRNTLSEIERQVDQFFRSPAESGLLAAVPEQLNGMRGVFSVMTIAPAMQAVARMRADVEQLLHGEAPDPRAPATQAAFHRLAGNLGALGFLIDMLSVQPQMTRQLFRFDMLNGVLSPVMGRSTMAPDVIDRAQAIAEAVRRHEMPLALVSAELAELSRDAQVSDQPELAASLQSAQVALAQAREAGAGHDTEDAAREHVAQAMDDFVATATSPMGLEPIGLPLISRPMSLGPEEPRAEFVPTGLEDDDEMRGIFLEESTEVLAEAMAALETLHHAPSDLSAMTTVRRAFHTLKGSSRMVGFTAFGDAAWASEQLYNHVLAEQTPASADLRTYTSDALTYFAAWIAGITRHDASAFAPEPVIAAADTLRLAGELMRVHLPGAAEPNAPAIGALDAVSDLVDLEVPIDDAPMPVLETLQATQPVQRPIEDLPPEPMALPEIDLVLDFEGADFDPSELDAGPGDASVVETGEAQHIAFHEADFPATDLAPPRAQPVSSPFGPPADDGLTADPLPSEPLVTALTPGPAVTEALDLSGWAPTGLVEQDATQPIEPLQAMDVPEVIDLPLDVSFDDLPAPADSASAPGVDVPLDLPLEVPLEAPEAMADSATLALEPDAGTPIETSDLSPLEVVPADETRWDAAPAAIDDEDPASLLVPLSPLPETPPAELPEVPVLTEVFELTEDWDGELPLADAQADAEPEPEPEPEPESVDLLIDPADLAHLAALDGIDASAVMDELAAEPPPDAEPAPTPEPEPEPGPAPAPVTSGAEVIRLADFRPSSSLPLPTLPGHGADEPMDLSALLGRDDDIKVVGPLRLQIPLFNIYLNEADELSRRLSTELTLWSLELDRPVGATAVALAHSLAGSSATVGFADLSQLARELEHALDRIQFLGAGEVDDAALFVAVGDEIRRLLHQFAAGFLHSPPPELSRRLHDWMESAALRQPVRSPESRLGDSTLDSRGVGDSDLAGLTLPTGWMVETDPAPPPAAAVDLPLDLPLDVPLDQATAPAPADPTHPASDLPTEAPADRVPTAGVDIPLAGHPGREDVAIAPPAAPVPHDDVAALIEALGEDIDQVDHVDAELFPIFDEEAQDLLPQLASQVSEWRRAPADPSAATACMRTLHTFKGSARLAGAMRLGELAHRFESAVEKLAGVAVSAADLDELQRRVDVLAAVFDSVRRSHGVAPATSMGLLQPSGSWNTRAGGLGSIHGELRTGHGAAVGSTGFGSGFDLSGLGHSGLGGIGLGNTGFGNTGYRTTGFGSLDAHLGQHPGGDASDPDAAALSLSPEGIDWQRFVAAGEPAPVSPTERAPVSAQPVRVRAPLLDRLVNLAGEVSITRARLESEVGSMRGSLIDLNENLDRLGLQLRDLTLQADTQLESRMQAARAASQEFDPLELDRYTRLQELARMMAESVNDVATVRSTMQRTLQTTEDELAVQARLTRELQGDLLRTRMVEFESLSERLYRVVRMAAKETGKQVRFDIVGGSIEVDRGVLDRMTAAFEHLLRNCVSHGIEPGEQRVAAGKDPTGSIVIELQQEGNEVSIEIRDDGAGLDLGRIRERAIAMGVIDAQTELPEKDLCNLIFVPGLSTSAVVTELSGRGVGMDVVRSDVHAMGGRIETRSTRGRGTRLRLVLPLTTVVTQVVILRAGAMQIAVPSNLVELVQRATPLTLEAAYQQGVYGYGGLQLPFFWLGALLDASGRGTEAGRTLPVVIVRSAQQRVALHVDDVQGSHEVVVKNLGPQLSRMPGLAGMTLLPTGGVALIYNPVALAAVYGGHAHRLMQMASAEPSPAPTLPELSGDRPAPLVLVVDDSLTVRRVTKRLLEREGYRVALAKDGLEALDALTGERPVAVLSDIEMPRMDGFDLLRNIRGDAQLASLPVIMITSRIARKHRDLATELGANHYLGKPYSEEELLGVLRQHASVQRRVVA